VEAGESAERIPSETGGSQPGMVIFHGVRSGEERFETVMKVYNFVEGSKK